MLKNRKVELSTIIGKGSTIKGNLQIHGGIRIDGLIEGTIETDGFVIIGSSGKAKADIKAKECLISGVLEGNVTVSETLELDKTSWVTGDIVAKVLTVTAGAMIVGTCQMGEKKPPRQANVIKDVSSGNEESAKKATN
ncbi:MAG: polymer-forming cytoskeletal protein [Candidatus Cloacimonetes bacterium]|nr:polymer-forming cytoskeletal protein [Candidatus Cloacimonadota bacterium]